MKYLNLITMKTLSYLLVSLFCITSAVAQSLQRVAPEQVGMDSRRLMYADEVIEEAIANKDIPGAVLAIVRDGKMAYLKAYGNKRVYRSPHISKCRDFQKILSFWG